jgi:riboflavin kinase/FMN adenylyltransferase
MELIRGLHNLRPRHRGSVATIGNFDGVHLGHKAIYRHLIEKGQELGLPATVITFEPQPLEFFSPEAAPARLTRFREKLLAIRDTGVDRVMLLEFNARLATMSAAQFVRRLLVEGLAVRYLFVGDDFRFGRGREGDIDLLRREGAARGFAVDNMSTFAVEQRRVSSTLIREALRDGDLRAAERMLGRPYRICGRIAHGDKRGRTIGFATANIDLHRRVSPVRGVFAVRVHGLAEGVCPGVANIGSRPTVAGDSRYLLEVHLFDFDREVYGEHVQVELIHKIREERRFGSFEELRRQIQSDAFEARARLGPAAG